MTTPVLDPVNPPLTTVTPNVWFENKFPALSQKSGEALHEEISKAGQTVVRDICEDFFASALGFAGMPDTPTVFIPTENRFYTYIPAEGIYIERREADLGAKLSQLFLECARACRETADVKKLEFGFRDYSSMFGQSDFGRSV